MNNKMKDNSVAKSSVQLDFRQPKIDRLLNSKINYANDHFKINLFCQISSVIEKFSSYSDKIRLKILNLSFFIKSSWICVALMKNCYFVESISVNLFRTIIFPKAFPG